MREFAEKRDGDRLKQTSARVAILSATLHLAEGSSLKDKRHVVKSLLEQTRNKFGVSVAEIGSLDLWQKAEIAAAVVGNDAAVCNSVMDKTLDYWESNPAFEIIESSIEMI